MRNHTSIIQKMPLRKRSPKDRHRDIKVLSPSTSGKKYTDSIRKRNEEELNRKESYNGGSTYGEHS